MDGSVVCAMIGPDVDTGITGYGKDVVEALRDLAGAIEVQGYPIAHLHEPNRVREERKNGLRLVK